MKYWLLETDVRRNDPPKKTYLKKWPCGKGLKYNFIMPAKIKIMMISSSIDTLKGRRSDPGVKCRTPDPEVVGLNPVLGRVGFSLPH